VHHSCSSCVTPKSSLAQGPEGIDVTLDPRIAAALFALAGVLFAVLGVRAARGRPFVAFAGAVTALALFAVAALCGALALSLHGYRALTREEVAAVVEIRPLTRQRFVARVTLPSGRMQSYEIAGDELYVDARVLKWHPWVNLLGLHTHYALDRIGGRYLDIEEERNAPRTVHSLGEDVRLDVFALRRKHDLLAPLVDASYGSGTFTAADRHATYEVRVSTTGLLVRERDAAQASAWTRGR
jgi:hypothetical protein